MKIDSPILKNIIESATNPGPPSDTSFHSTCVFLILFYKTAEPYVLTIQKSDSEGYPWRNQVALPGGHVDKEDPSSLEAAFRELQEELNISKDQIEHIGSIGHFQTINNKDIEVFLGLWNGKGQIKYDSEEISRVIQIPLKEFVKTHISNNFHGCTPSIYDLTYTFKDVVIWGVTARIIHHFIELLYPLIKDQGN